MFPQPPIRRLTDSLLELADIALRPEHEPAATCAAEPPQTTEAAPSRPERAHPHRTRLRIERERRRGAALPRPQHCVTPVSRPAPARTPVRRL